MLTEYIEEALKRAHYEIINGPDEPYYGEVPELPGVWANAKTLETCRENLKEVVEGWILLSIKKALPLPKRRSCVKAKLTPVSWQELMKRLRALGFEGPFAG
jgi:predicted RNase H-like HicB family nuclease